MEYKAGRDFGKPVEIAKDVSAMANSTGGVIVYGIRTDPDDKTLPVEVVGVDRKNIETFDQIVNAHIRPTVPNVRTRVLEADDGTAVMVVQIPESDEAPHQVLGDCRYYRRAGTQSRPMEHDLVALYFGRRRRPRLAVDVQALTDLSAMVFRTETT